MGRNIPTTTTATAESGSPSGRRPLLPDERLVAVSGDGVLTITNQRVLYDWGTPANSRYLSMTLDSVSSCGLSTSSQPILLVLGIVAAIIGIVTINDQEVGPACLIVGAVLVLLFFVTKTAALLICSDGGERISLPGQPGQRGAYLALLDAIDGAKLVALETKR